jgi:predicted MPP superfamily phosphohydrolase
MLPGLEALGLAMLVNEHVELRRAGASLFLVGIDDAHYYGVDNVAQAASTVPADAVSILLSHTPEIYRQAAHAGFDLMLCGHTHGGQICLPGERAITLDARCPRYMGNGPWRYERMRGYTSVGSGSCIVPVRLNCLPEVTLHTLRAV